LLEHYARSGQLARLATGTTIAHLPQQQLRRVPVPLPPLDEQRRIVDLLDDHLSRLDAADAYLTGKSPKVTPSSFGDPGVVLVRPRR
jgi:type I restriction enzyme S subunit